MYRQVVEEDRAKGLKRFHSGFVDEERWLVFIRMNVAMSTVLALRCLSKSMLSSRFRQRAGSRYPAKLII